MVVTPKHQESRAAGSGSLLDSWLSSYRGMTGAALAACVQVLVVRGRQK